jgi:hypothetical protein
MQLSPFHVFIEGTRTVIKVIEPGCGAVLRSRSPRFWIHELANKVEIITAFSRMLPRTLSTILGAFVQHDLT